MTALSATTYTMPTTTSVATATSDVFTAADVDRDGMLSSTEFVGLQQMTAASAGHGCHGRSPEDYRAAIQSAASTVDGGGTMTTSQDVQALAEQLAVVREQLAALIEQIGGTVSASTSTSSSTTEPYTYATDESGQTYAQDNATGNVYLVNADGTGTLVTSGAS